MGQDSVRVDATGHHYGHVVGDVIGIQPIQEIVARNAADCFLSTQNGLPVGMLAIVGIPDLIEEIGIGIVISLIPFAQDDIPFTKQLFFRKKAVDQDVSYQVY